MPSPFLLPIGTRQRRRSVGRGQDEVAELPRRSADWDAAAGEGPRPSPPGRPPPRRGPRPAAAASGGMDAAAVLGTMVPSWSAAVVLVPLREARRPSGCSLRTERHGHWYERMQPEPAAEGDASASSSSSASTAVRRPEVPYPDAYSCRLCSLPRPRAATRRPELCPPPLFLICRSACMCVASWKSKGVWKSESVHCCHVSPCRCRLGFGRRYFRSPTS